MQLPRVMDGLDPRGEDREIAPEQREPLVAEASRVSPHVSDEVGAGHELHGEVAIVCVYEELVQLYEILVHDARERPELPLEAQDARRVRRSQRLQGHDLPSLEVCR